MPLPRCLHSLGIGVYLEGQGVEGKKGLLDKFNRSQLRRAPFGWAIVALLVLSGRRDIAVWPCIDEG